MVTMPANDSDLCVRCGLCCNGAVFDYGPLAAKEVDLARSNGMAVLEADGAFGFAQPCPALDHPTCTVYAARPGTCRAYRCKLLRAHAAGDITAAEALAIIAETRAACDAVIAALPPGATLTDARALRRKAVRAEGAALQIAPPQLMIALGLLDLIIDQHFRTADQRQIMPRG